MRPKTTRWITRGNVVPSMSPRQSDRALVHATTLYSRRLLRAVAAETHPPLAKGTHDRHPPGSHPFPPPRRQPASRRLQRVHVRGYFTPLEFRAFRAVAFGILYTKYLCILIIALKQKGTKDDIFKIYFRVKFI